MLEGSDSGCEPQRGCDLQPRVAASATLGTRLVEFNRKAVAPILIRRGDGATALRLGFNESLTQGSRSGQPGAEGHNRVAVRGRTPDPAWAFFSRL